MVTNLLAVLLLSMVLFDGGEGVFGKLKGKGRFTGPKPWKPKVPSGTKRGGQSSDKSDVKSSPKPGVQPNQAPEERQEGNYFDEGGFSKFEEIIDASVYAVEQMSASVYIRQDEEPTGSLWDDTFCYDCISINGSKPECEDFSTSSLPNCRTSYERPYCSVEYGVLSNNQKFVRRSCQDKQCRHCSSDGDVTEKCHTFQCSLCRSSKCNEGGVREVFNENRRPGKNSSASMRMSFVMQVIAILLTFCEKSM